MLIFTTFQDDEVLSAALRAGAADFLLKDAPGEEILRAVRTLAGGGAYLDAAVTARVLQLVGRGLSNEEIADQLVIGERTVKTHIGRIFDVIRGMRGE